MPTKKPNLKLIIGVILAILVLTLPFYRSNFQFVIMLACINILLASSMRVSLNVGLWNFGVVGFMAIGAYTSSLLRVNTGLPYIVSFLAAGAVAMAVGLAVGLPSLRLRGVYFLLISLGFSEFVRTAAIKWLPVYSYPSAIDIGSFAIQGTNLYYFTVILTLLIMFVLYRIEKTRLGLTWKSIAQEEGLAESVGISTYQMRLSNLALSCFVAGITGSLYSQVLGLVTHQSFGFLLTTYVVIWNFAGGLGSFWGPVLGGLILTLAIEPLSSLQYYQTIAYAGAIIIIVMLLPGGMVTLPQRLRSLGRRPKLQPAIEKVSDVKAG